MCLWNEPPQVSDRVVFAEFDWKYPNFLKYKKGEWGVNILLFNYTNDLALGSVETIFWKSVCMCLWNEPPQLSQGVVFANLSENTTIC